jgi:hypothetical protein
VTIIEPLEYRDPDPDGLFDGIGRVAAEGARLETQLTELLVLLVESPSAAYLVRGQGTDQLIQQIRVVAKAPISGAHIAYRDKLLRHMDEAKALQDQRNHVVHSTWDQFDPDEGPAGYALASRPRRHRLFDDTKTMNRSELLGLARELESLSWRLYALTLNFSDAVAGREPSTGDSIRFSSLHYESAEPPDDEDFWT